MLSKTTSTFLAFYLGVGSHASFCVIYIRKLNRIH